MRALCHVVTLAAAIFVLAAFSGSTTAPATAQWNPWECYVQAVEPAHHEWYIWSQGQIKCGQYMDVQVWVCLQWFDHVDQSYYNVECSYLSAERFAGHLWTSVQYPCYEGRFRTYTYGHAQWPDGSGAWSDGVVSSPVQIYC